MADDFAGSLLHDYCNHPVGDFENNGHKVGYGLGVDHNCSGDNHLPAYHSRDCSYHVADHKVPVFVDIHLEGGDYRMKSAGEQSRM